ncbi:MAG TPA: exonuclease SbcCD subunit D [Streptosporangiaceae bacterium]|nr:exonuclease SbcCD subunit D [Streptosporangiaceae bacterium]
MRILHTADWHVGKVLKGRSRVAEHTAVLGEIVDIARAEDVDVVIVAGDVFDAAAPVPAAQALVMRTLLALREDDRQVVVLAGNHDNPHLLDVYRPVLGTVGIHVVGTFRGPENGGVISFTARSGEEARIAVLPFLSHRFAVRAAEALRGTPPQHSVAYSLKWAELAGALTSGFGSARDETVNLLTAHATLRGGRLGGGEREAQTVMSYYVEPGTFPETLQYAALGHLHRRQRLPGPCPLWYAGSPLAVDFGDETIRPGVLIVTVGPGEEAQVRTAEITAARRLRTVRGSLDELAALAPDLEGVWLRVVVAEPPRPGLAEAVRELLPDALSIDIDERFRPARRHAAAVRHDRGPRGLFRDYLAASGHGGGDELTALFDRLLDEVTSEEATSEDVTSEQVTSGEGGADG